jgi:hypothetical protein
MLNAPGGQIAADPIFAVCKKIMRSPATGAFD